MSESTTYTTPASAEPTRRWNYRSCDGTQCRWIHNLLPNERCWNCNELPEVPSDEPDVIVAVPSAPQYPTAWANEAAIEILHEKNATLTRQLETARNGLYGIIHNFGASAKIAHETLAAIDAPLTNSRDSLVERCDAWPCAMSAGHSGAHMPTKSNRLPCPDCSQDAGGVAKLCAKLGGSQPDGSDVAVAYGHLAQGQSYTTPESSRAIAAEPFSAEDARESARANSLAAARLRSGDDEERTEYTERFAVEHARTAATLRHYADLTERVNRVVANLNGPEPHSRGTVIRILQGNERGGE